MFKRIALVLISVLITQSAYAKNFVAGEHYKVLPTPVATRDKNKIEVVELFWYGCFHCHTMEPVISNWERRLAGDVDFHAMPAVWMRPMGLHAKVYYTAKALGILDRSHKAFFKKINVDQNKMSSESAIAEFFKTQGIDGKTFTKVFNSASVNRQVAFSKQRGLAYGMERTPEIVVNGKYRVSGGTHEEKLQVADYLIAKERAAMAK